MKRGTQSRWHHDPPKKEGAEVSNIKGMLSKKQWNTPKKKRKGVSATKWHERSRRCHKRERQAGILTHRHMRWCVGTYGGMVFLSLDGSSSTRLIFVWSSCGEVVLIRALSAEPTQTPVSPSRRVNASVGNNFQILYCAVYIIRNKYTRVIQ